jgi:sporulation protein YlmC with PRC-barrel domain
MTRKLLASVALSALMASSVYAQTATAPRSGSTPHMTAPTTTPSQNGNGATGKAETAAPAGTEANAQSGEAKVVAAQKPSQLLASKFKGTEVVGSDNKKVGSIGDILFEKDGRIDAYVVSFGGFLGMGGKEIAIAPSSFQVVAGTNGEPDKLKLDMNKSELQSAQKFAEYTPPKPVSPSGGGGTMGGGLGTHPPATGMR